MGASQVDSAFVSILSASALEPFRRVKLNTSGQVTYAGAGEDHIGITQSRVEASATPTSVKLKTGPGTFQGTASVAISINDRLYGAASGKITNVADGACIGVAKSAASGDGSRFEYLVEATNGDDFVTVEHTVTAGEQSANTDGRYDFDTGFAAVPALVLFGVRTSAGVDKTSGKIMNKDTPGAGVVRIDGVAGSTTTQLRTNDIISIAAWKKAH